MTKFDTRFVRRLEGVLDHALGVLEAALDDPAVPVEQRRALALRLLELGVADQKPVTAAPVMLPVEFATVPHFLSPTLYQDVVALAAAERERLQPSSVTSNEAGYRQSRVLYDSNFESGFSEIERKVQSEIAEVLPSVCAALGQSTFTPARVEVQLTAHGDGDFFRVHSDTGAPETMGRTLTFVIYFQLRQPRSFEGGALRMYQTEIDGEGRTHQLLEVYRDLVPEDNMVVFFDSRLMHEVLPVRVSSGAYEDGRFTLNGWLHRSAPAA
jgi:Rps23 Pro-64 3,4-dihydroxylase Tpa1-like proline 4-hydroxylase